MNIREIARLSGVSIATVSRVINTPQLVQEQTRARVEEAMRAAQYVPGRGGAHRGRRRAMLFLFNEADYNFYERIQEGFETVTQPHHYVMLFCQVSAAAERRAAQMDALLRQRPAGAIWALRDFYPEEAARFTAAGVPLVLARRYDGAPAGLPCCYTDFTVGSFRMTQHLLSCGCRRVALLVEKVSFQFVSSFCAGWRRAYFENGLPFSEEWIVHTPNTVQGGYERVRELLRAPDAPDAFFCASNEMAFGALRAARELGVPVPERLAIAGFTDSPVATLSEPPLTTISQPIRQQGAVVARMLLDRIETPPDAELQPQEIVLQPRLCIRGTCGSRPAQPDGT